MLSRDDLPCKFLREGLQRNILITPATEDLEYRKLFNVFHDWLKCKNDYHAEVEKVDPLGLVPMSMGNTSAYPDTLNISSERVWLTRLPARA
jgi:hypothetical protein